MEKILKETYVNPKIELTQDQYNRLVDLAKMKAKKIEERAREFYEKEGVAKICFEGRIHKKEFGELTTQYYKFECKPRSYDISPSGEFEKPLFSIPTEERKRIAQKVGRYVEDVFMTTFGEKLYNLNEILKIKKQAERDAFIFKIMTITGWLTSLILVAVALFK